MLTYERVWNPETDAYENNIVLLHQQTDSEIQLNDENNTLLLNKSKNNFQLQSQIELDDEQKTFY